MTFINVTSKQIILANIVFTVNKTAFRPYYELLNKYKQKIKYFPNNFIISKDESCLCLKAPSFLHLGFGRY